LSIAISQFAPGSETVKDKAIYTAVGITDYVKRGPRLEQIENPFGHEVTVGVCKRCQALDKTPNLDVNQCPVCGSIEDYRVINLSQPRGFCTAYGVERAFDGQFEWTARASRAKMPIPTEESDWHTPQTAAYRINASSELIYIINDNDGQDFPFQRMKSSNAWIVPETLPSNPKRSYPVDNLVKTCALSAVSDTDVLLIGFSADKVMKGVNLNPIYLPQRAAWYSFGFLIRDIAASMLDVDRQEMQIGLRTRPGAGAYGTETEIFLADRLENGAGYATYLGREDVFAYLLERCIEEKPRLEQHGTPQCDSSCYDCLRDYSNMPYHGLLDWRLAMDMVRLALGQSVRLDGYWQPLVRQSVENFARIFGWTAQQFGPLEGLVRRNIALIVGHPLWNEYPSQATWNEYPSQATEELVLAIDEAEHMGYTQNGSQRWRLIDIFEVIRRPAWYDANL
jgi:hypothetical protein